MYEKLTGGLPKYGSGKNQDKMNMFALGKTVAGLLQKEEELKQAEAMTLVNRMMMNQREESLNQKEIELKKMMLELSSAQSTMLPSVGLPPMGGEMGGAALPSMGGVPPEAMGGGMPMEYQDPLLAQGEMPMEGMSPEEEVPFMM